MYVANCIICAKGGKRVPATHWTGYVLLVDDTRKEDVIAGSCEGHWKEFDALPHLDHISSSGHCVGVWMPDYGTRND